MRRNRAMRSAAPPAWAARYAGEYAALLGETPLYATRIVRRGQHA